MNPSKIFIERPIATILIMAAILISGLFAYPLLPVSSLPEVDYPTVQVSTFFPGSSPMVMESSITAPLERQLGEMPGLEKMTSVSANGSSLITLQFGLAMSLDIAEQQVQAAINAASGLLPSDLPNPPVYNKVNPADAPILTLSLTSPILPLYTVEDYAETRLAQKISQLTGVGQVSIGGGQRPAVRIRANSAALASYGLTLESVRSVIDAANVNAAKGNLDGPNLSYTLETNDQLLSSADYKPLIISVKNNAPVRLSDIADVTDSVENTNEAAWVNTTPAVIMNIQRQPGANVIAVVDKVKTFLNQLKSTLPAAIKVAVLSDRTLTIQASVHDVQFELLLSVCLVILVIFLFLRHLPATVIPSISVPLSLIGAFGVMYLLGFSLNNLTLMALTIATGFVVDDAIVMIENIMRYIEQGEKPLEAALKGSRQIVFTIISLTLSLSAVLIPLLFMQEIMGRLFREFALTLVVTIFISAFVSLTLTPMLCAKILSARKTRDLTGFDQWVGNCLERILLHYKKTLAWSLSHQKFMLGLFCTTILMTGVLLYAIPKGFFPSQDTGMLQGFTQGSPSDSFHQMAQKQTQLASALLKDPDVEALSSLIGVGGTNTTLNSGRMLISLKPLEKGRAKASEIVSRLQKNVSNMPGMQIFLQPVQDLTMDARISPGQYQISVASADIASVQQWSSKLADELKKLSALKNISSDQQDNGLFKNISIDRNSASRLGITPQMLDEVLYDAFGQRQISTLFTQRNQYHVILESQSQSPQDALNNVYFTSATGKPIPLSVFTTINSTVGPLAITHQDQFPSVTLSFDLAPRVSLHSAISQINQVIHALKAPNEVQIRFEGSAKIFQSSLHNESGLMLAAIFVVYIVLGVLYESLIHPLVILSTLPSAAMGALLGLYLTGNDLNVIALIGIILLMGIVMKNAILMIDFALEQERQYFLAANEAIFQAALLRFRPIVMTTMAALLGAVPIALGAGMGSELRQPLGIAIIAGLMVSQLLTLYTTPVVYLFFDKILNSSMISRR